MTLLLGLETSTKICSVALSDGNRLLAMKEESGAYSHAEKLTTFIREVFLQANVKIENMDAICVSKGPGSYTGLRIGVSVAKGLCYALNKPLIAVDTLQSMALRLSKIEDADLYCPMIDARRMEVYTALYDKNNTLIQPVSANIVDETSFADLSNKKVVFFGDGAEKCRTVLSGHLHMVFSNQGLPSSEFVNQLAFEKFDKQEFENVAYFEPYYLKDFIGTKAKKLL